MKEYEFNVSEDLQNEFKSDCKDLINKWHNKMGIYNYAVISTWLSIFTLLRVVEHEELFDSVLNKCIECAKEEIERIDNKGK